MPVLRATLREAASRRLLLAVAILTAVFVALFTIGALFLRDQLAQEASTDPVESAFVGTLLTVLGLYVASFLAAFLALFLSAGAVSSELESGQLHAVLARPIARGRWLLERWLGFAVVAVAYTLALGTLLLLVSRQVIGYESVRPVVGLALMALQTLTLLTLGVLGSTRLSTLANGAVVFFAFGMAWMSGLVEFIGAIVDNPSMERVGVVVSLLVPSDALWRGASAALSSPAFLAAAGGNEELGLPFTGLALPALPFLAWSIALVPLMLALAIRSFSRRDL